MGVLLEERSPVARKAYSATAAQLSRLTPTEPMGEMLRELVMRYGNESATNEDERLVIASLMRDLQRGAPDAMGKLRVDWLPLAFVGRHEPRWESESDAPAEKNEDGKLATVWHETFDEAGGNTGAIVQHLAEVMTLLGTAVEGTSWPLRRASAYALIELARLPPSAMAGREAFAAEMGRLASALGERKWRGKEAAMPELRAAFPRAMAPVSPKKDPPVAEH